MDRANERSAPGVRLVQAAFHNRSLSLYTSLGFDIREPLSCLQGQTLERNIPGCTVRLAKPDDEDACNALARRVHGFDRANGYSSRTVFRRLPRLFSFAEFAQKRGRTVAIECRSGDIPST
jgi:hypothetical protein